MTARVASSLLAAAVALLIASCGPLSREEEAANRDAARAAAQATATARALPTVIAELTAVAQATQQATDVDVRVRAAVAATHAAIPTATPTAVPPTATSVPATATPVPAPTEVAVAPTPIVIVVPQSVSPVYVPVPVPAPSGQAPQYIIDAINMSNNAYTAAKWSLNTNDLFGRMVGPELARGQEYVRGLVRNRTRVSSSLIGGNVTSWTMNAGSRVTATTNETWHFVNYDADQYTLKRDNGARLYRNIYTIDYMLSLGWRVSADDVPNPNGDLV